MNTTSSSTSPEIKSWRDLSPLQIKSGVAAWLGWLFDGLDGTLYTMVAAQFVMILLNAKSPTDPEVTRHSAYIQATFLFGWAVGGAVFGRIGDRIGRTKTISLTILTYALFTGLSSFSHTWWHLLIFRFLAALGIGGEWAAGSSLISETWPRRWRPWMSAVLQSAYQGGYFLAALTLYFLSDDKHVRYVFVVGALPALLVFWIRRAIPEPEEWHAARNEARAKAADPGILDLFKGKVLKTTVLTIAVCSFALTTVWSLIFWMPQQLRALPDIADWTASHKNEFIARVTALTTLSSVFGNFFGAAIARYFGYRKSAAIMFFGGLVTMLLTYGKMRTHTEMMFFLPLTHFFVQGVFGLFPLYIPPLFPTLLRTTGSGFCYNIGRMVTAIGTVAFALFMKVGDFNTALVWVGCLYIPAIGVALIIPEPPQEAGTVSAVE